MGTRLIPNSDAWAGSWGLTWAGSWSWSWANGTDIEVDEEHGGGGAGYIPKAKRKAARNTQEKDLMEMLTDIMAAGLLEG